MSAPPRLLQNFSGYRAHLVVAQPSAADPLADVLARLGLTPEVAPLADGCVELALEAMRPERDVLFVDGDIAQPFGGGAGPAATLALPVIGLVGVEAPSRLKALMSLGATALLRKPVHGGTVYSALVLGINGFFRRRHLENRVAELESRRSGRRFVIKAVLWLMRERGLDDEAAFEALRREAMRTQTTVEETCERLLRTAAATDEAAAGGATDLAQENGHARARDA
jgi:AmiR/NasT family two-component response regulator